MKKKNEMSEDLTISEKIDLKFEKFFIFNEFCNNFLEMSLFCQLVLCEKC